MKVILLDMPKYMGRKDVKRPSWFALDLDFLTCRAHFGKMNPQRLMAMIYIVTECFKSENPELELVDAHLTFHTQMKIEEFLHACGELAELKLIQLLPAHDRARSHTCSTDRQTDKTLHSSAHVPEHVSGQLTYVPLDEEQPRKKKERKPKMELPCDVIPALEGIREIVEIRKVPSILQEKWVKQYPAAMIFNAVRAADGWATAKGKVYANWGLFFTNWLQREFKGNRFPDNTKFLGGNQNTAAQEPPKRKHFWVQQEEERMAREREGKQ